MDQITVSSNEEYFYNKLGLIEIDFDSSTPEPDSELVWKSLSNCYYSGIEKSDISLFYNKKFFILFLEEEEGNKNSRIPHGFFTATVRLFNNNCYVTIWDLCKTYIDEKNTPNNICSFILKKYFEYLSNSHYIYKLPTINSTNYYKIDEVHIYVNSNQSINNQAESCYLNMNFRYIEPPQIEETVDTNGMKTVYRKMKRIINPMMGVFNKSISGIQQPMQFTEPIQSTQPMQSYPEDVISKMEVSSPIQDKYSTVPDKPHDYDDRNNPLDVASSDIIPPQNLGLDGDSQPERDNMLQDQQFSQQPGSNQMDIQSPNQQFSQQPGSNQMDIQSPNQMDIQSPDQQFGQQPNQMDIQSPDQQFGQQQQPSQMGDQQQQMGDQQQQMGDQPNQLDIQSPDQQFGQQSQPSQMGDQQFGQQQPQPMSDQQFGQQQQQPSQMGEQQFGQQQQQQPMGEQQFGKQPQLGERQFGQPLSDQYPNHMDISPEQQSNRTNISPEQQFVQPQMGERQQSNPGIQSNTGIQSNPGIQLSGHLGQPDRTQQQQQQYPMGGKTKKRRRISNSKTKKKRKEKKYKKSSKKPTKRRSFKSRRNK